MEVTEDGRSGTPRDVHDSCERTSTGQDGTMISPRDFSWLAAGQMPNAKRVSVIADGRSDQQEKQSRTKGTSTISRSQRDSARDNARESDGEVDDEVD